MATETIMPTGSIDLFTLAKNPSLTNRYGATRRAYRSLINV